MGTTREDIREWLKEAKRKKATHLIVATDTFDWEDYPIYVLPGQDVRKIYDEHQGPNMQKVMEVYSMKLDLEKQLSEDRSFHFE